tara:strand:+ start:99 stop:410 length:312 start_codon:yes stop_codon:yes gene_type:complete
LVVTEANNNRETNNMTLTFNTNRPYSKEGQLIQAAVNRTYLDKDGDECQEVFFNDTTRRIGGVMTYYTMFDTFNETSIMRKYDTNNFDDDRYTEVRKFFEGKV